MANYQSIHTGSIIDNVISNVLLKSEALSTYLTQVNAANIYLTQTDAINTFLTQIDATNIYLTQMNAANTYLKITDAASTYVGLTNNQTISGVKTFSVQPLLSSGFKWPAPSNITCTASANSQEWSIDCGTSGYTGCFFHIWSAIQSASILQCFVDNRHVAIPVHLYVGDYNNTSFGISTNSLISNGTIQGNGAINAPSGSIWAGTRGNTAAERQVGTQAGAGWLYIYAQAATTGGRGLYGGNAAGTSAGYISINQSNAATYSATSDKRIKIDKGILSQDETFNILNELQIVRFNYRDDVKEEEKNNVEHVGIYAQDFRDIILNHNYKNRNLISMTLKNNEEEIEDTNYITPIMSQDLTIPEEEVDLYQMNYTALIPYLIKGWQMHEQKIQQLEEQIKVLINK